MSRCFPFPPPGYEKKPRAENLDLLTKERRKEKKHKKEKKEKEKREHRDKNEKDRSKDKRKEKRDRKEKHKDRKKDKDIIDKGRPSEDGRSEDRNEGTHNREILQAAEAAKDSKFAEELGRRIRDNGADNRTVGIISNSIHGKFEGTGAARPSLDKDSRAADKKVFPVPIGRNPPVENATNSPHRRPANTGTATTSMHQKFAVGINADQNRNHGISRSIEAVINQKAECSTTTAGMEKEKIAEKLFVSNSVDNNGKLGAKAAAAASNSASTKRKNDFLGSPGESLSSIRCKPESTGAAPAIDRERVKGGGMLPHPFSSEQRRNTTIFQPVQKVNRQDEVTKGNKAKDTDKYTKEEEEKVVEKAAATAVAIENNSIRNLGKKDQIDTLNNSKPLAPHRDSAAGIRGIDETSIRRKNLKINGFIQENDARPNKMPRMVASSPQPLSGLPLKPDRVLDHKKKDINGSAKSRPLPDGNGEAVSLKSPHPDSKYLEQIHAVPKMEPFLEEDGGDQEWLFNPCQMQKPKRQHEESISQVWAQASRIESADVLALPYVLPF